MPKKPKAPPATRPAVRALRGALRVIETDRQPTAPQQPMGPVTDAYGVVWSVTIAYPAANVVYLSSPGRPTRYVLLADLLGAMLDAGE